MRKGIATDHLGFALKAEIQRALGAPRHDVVDFVAHGLNPSDDEPDFVIPLTRAAASGSLERGNALCGSGVGVSVSMAANKMSGVRAGPIHDVFSARHGVEDDGVESHGRIKRAKMAVVETPSEESRPWASLSRI